MTSPLSENDKNRQNDDAVIETALAWQAQGLKVALATVISTWGSAPRPAGSQIAVNQNEGFVGSVSGGCIEGAVIHAGLDVLQGGAPELLEFGVSNADAWEVGLACGGTIKIYICAFDEERAALYRSVHTAMNAKQCTALVTSLTHHTDQSVTGDEPGMAPLLAKAIKRVIKSDKAGTVTIKGEDLFINPFNPPLRMFIVGAVHIAQPLSRMARESGYDVTIIDPREAFASQQRFPDVAISHDWPDEAIIAGKPDPRCAVVTLSHDPKIDDPALHAALRTNCFYIGSLGSTKTHGARLERLAAEGFDTAATDRVHGPVGLSIGARSPAEIAISILAEITDVLRSEPK